MTEGFPINFKNYRKFVILNDTNDDTVTYAGLESDGRKEKIKSGKNKKFKLGFIRSVIESGTPLTENFKIKAKKILGDKDNKKLREKLEKMKIEEVKAEVEEVKEVEEIFHSGFGSGIINSIKETNKGNIGIETVEEANAIRTRLLKENEEILKDLPEQIKIGDQTGARLSREQLDKNLKLLQELDAAKESIEPVSKDLIYANEIQLEMDRIINEIKVQRSRGQGVKRLEDKLERLKKTFLAAGGTFKLPEALAERSKEISGKGASEQFLKSEFEDIKAGYEAGEIDFDGLQEYVIEGRITDEQAEAIVENISDPEISKEALATLVPEQDPQAQEVPQEPQEVQEVQELEQQEQAQEPLKSVPNVVKTLLSKWNPKYHLVPIKIMYGTVNVVPWDQSIINAVNTLTLTKSEINKLIDAIVASYRFKLLLFKRKSNGDKVELNEVLQLQYSFERGMRTGARGAEALVKLSDLTALSANLNTPQTPAPTESPTTQVQTEQVQTQTPQQQLENVIEELQPTKLKEIPKFESVSKYKTRSSKPKLVKY